MIATLKKYNKLLDEKQKRKIIFLFFIMLISTVLEVLSVSMMVPIISAIMDQSFVENNVYAQKIYRFLNLPSYNAFIILCIVAIIVLYVFKDLFIIFENYVRVRFVCNNRLAMQKKLLGIIIRRPYEFYLNIKTGEVTQMVISDANSAYGLLSTLLSVVTEVIVSLALALTVFILDPMMTTLVVSILGVCLLIITKIARPKIKVAGKTFRKNNANLNSWMIQIVNGIKEIKITRKEKFFEKQYVKIANEGIRAEKLYKTINGIPKSLIEMAAVSGALIALLIMLLNGKNLNELLPTLSAFAIAAIKLLPSVNKIATSLNDITYATPHLDKLISNLDNIQNECNSVLYDSKKELDGEECRIVLDEKITFSGLSYHYPNVERNVLENANIEIPAGSSVGIVGVSGSGKTTTVDLILGLLQPQKGTIFVDDKDIFDNYQGWLSNIGYIPQSIFMLDGTIRDNVAFGVPEKKVDEERVWAAVREAQLEEFVLSLPGGLDSTVGERGIRISGGQRQRIGIARALYYNPSLLVFDEATSALDNGTEAAIMEAINSLHGKKTMIIIAHRLQTISGCDIIYRVEDGKILREK